MAGQGLPRRSHPDGSEYRSEPPVRIRGDRNDGSLVEVKIVSLDYYRSRQGYACSVVCPPGQHNWSRGPRLPVIRVFGVERSTGQKIAVHVHNVLPYFFVQLPEVHSGMPFLAAVPVEDGRRLEEHFGDIFWNALDGALDLHHSLAFEGNGGHEDVRSGLDEGRRHFDQVSRVAGVQVVKAVPFYGYHRYESLWLKISLYDPADVKRAARLVGSGAVMGMKFQPHESHIPYLLQFKVDHNLYGMDWLKLRSGCYREGESPPRTLEAPAGGKGDPLHSFTRAETLAKQTTCALEVDVCPGDIVNTMEKKHSVDITLAPMEEQIVDSLVPMWAAERLRQGRSNVAPTPPDIGTRHVEQIDSRTVAYWREKFQEAEEMRVKSMLDGHGGDQGEAGDPVAETETFGSQWQSQSQVISQEGREAPSYLPPRRPLQGVGSQLQSMDPSVLGSLVDIDAVRSTQWVGSTRPSKLNQVQESIDVMEHWGERQRELGHTCRGGGDEPDDERIMELADLIRNEEAAGTQRVCSQREEAPSRFHLEQRVQQALHEGVLSDHNECQDIMEASQLFDAEMKMTCDALEGGNAAKMMISVEPGHGGVARRPAEPQSLDDVTKAVAFASETERDQVRETGRRLSEIREIFSGKPRRERRASAGAEMGPIEPNPPGAHRHPDNLDLHKVETGMMSQDVVAFWSEPVSQVPFDDGEMTQDQDEAEMAETNEPLNENNQTLPQTDETTLEPRQAPPSRLEVAAMPVIHVGPHFSNPADMAKRTQVFGGKTHHLKASSVSDLAIFGAAEDLLEARLGQLDAGFASRVLQAKLGGGEGVGRGTSEILLLELPQQPPKRDTVDQWMARVREAQANFTMAKKADISSHSPAAMLDPNSGKFLPEDLNRASQASLVATPLLPSWEGDIEDRGVDGGQAQPRTSPSLVAILTAPESLPDRSGPLVPSCPSNATPRTPPRPSCSQNPVQPASPKYDEIDVLYKDVLDGAAVNDQIIRRGSKAHNRQSFSQISWGGSRSTDVTPESQMGLNPAKRASTKGEGLTILCIEVHAESRQGLLPDPTRDAVCAVVLTMCDDRDVVVSGQYCTRIIMIKQRERVWPNFEAMQDVDFDFVASEDALFSSFRDFVLALDPDILLGFEIQRSSLGYLADRARCEFNNASFLSDISRVPSERVELAELGENDQYGWDHDSGFRVAGRVVLNMWRTIRAEVKLQSYSFENCVASILKIRVPHIKRPKLHSMFKRHETRWRCLSHYVLCNRLCLHMIEQLDFIGRTSELARTFGIDFFSVVSRGSQYRVESMMLRLAHSQNYIALSPNNEQVARQPAMEALPLVMEPESGMYEDPVCVLDFQSLYPSMIIAYNLCFSTCIGRPGHLFWEAPNADGDLRPNDPRDESVILDAGDGAEVNPKSDMDGDQLDPRGSNEAGRETRGSMPRQNPPRLGCRESFALDAPLSASNINPANPTELIVTPNGIGFVPPSRRRGVLPRLLHEILQTRIMIKSAMRNAPSNAKALTRSLNAKQFALKLIANVTYGYTAAGFSGRMPMAELADAIVQSGRETLEDTIRFIKNHPDWRADVIYGDTDSIFVRLKGRTLEEAHRIGLEIAHAVTARNPDPVLLKLEKVYHPCFLLSKKRYVGAMYESPSQKRFQFDAKGIETVRRDSCPAVSKIVEQSLRILFTSADVSAVKTYVERQWKRIISGRVSIMDFIFAKEVRLGTYAAERASGGSLAASIPPAALVATKAMAKDPRAEPRYGERVCYVVVHGEPGARLIDMVVEPEMLIESGGTLRLHAVYYITKQIIPALERFMRLIGVNVQTWYARIPKATRFLPHKRPLSTIGGVLGPKTTSRPTIDHFYLSRHCICCDALTMVNEPLCRSCQDDKQLVAFALPHRLNRIERQYVHIGRICSTCGGVGARGEVICESLDCSLYFERRKVWYERKTVQGLALCLDDDDF